MSPRTWCRLRLGRRRRRAGAPGLAARDRPVPRRPAHRSTPPPSLAGLLIGVPTTVCCAWRWRLVARGRGIDLPVREAVTAYYRSQFLNTTLPGGVLGDVHRAVAPRARRPVALERVPARWSRCRSPRWRCCVLPSPRRTCPCRSVLLRGRAAPGGSPVLAAAGPRARAGLGARGRRPRRHLRGGRAHRRRRRLASPRLLPARARRAGRHEHPRQRRRLGTARGRGGLGVRRRRARRGRRASPPPWSTA